MNQMFCFLARAQRGATAVEYALIVALVAVVIIGAVTLLGEELVAIFEYIAGVIGGTVPAEETTGE